MGSFQVSDSIADAEVVGRIRGGDDRAWEAVFSRYADRMYTLCFSVLRSDEAADATQDAFLIALQHLGSLRDPAALRPWLFRIAWTAALRRAKQRARSTSMAPIAMDRMSLDPGPDTVAQQRELQRLVAEAAAGLPQEDRVVLELSLRQGLQGDELADALGVSTSYARKLVQRVRARADRALGALLVAVHGRASCGDLQQILAGWDGAFNPLIRKRVARHIDGCAVCSNHRAQLASPTALLAAAPLLIAPAGTLEPIRASLAATASAGHTAVGSSQLHLGSMAPSRLPQAAGAIALGAIIVTTALLWPRPSAGQPVQLAPAGNRNSLELAVDGAGRAFVTWVDHTTVPASTIARVGRDGGWSEQVNLSQGFVNPGSATFRVRPDGTMCAFFHGIIGADWLTTYGLYERCWTGDEWTAPTQVTRINRDAGSYLTTNWSPAYDSAGKVRTSFTTPPNTVGFEGRVLSGPGFNGMGTLVTDSVGRLHLLWYNAHTGNMEHRWSGDSGQTWSVAVPVAPYAATQLAPDAKGGVHVTSVIGGQVRHRHWTRDAGWSDTTNVAGDLRNYLTYGGLAGLDGGKAAVAWTDDDGLVVSESDAVGSFGMPSLVEATAGKDISMASLAAGGGHLHAVWLTRDGEVVYQRLR